MSNFINNNTEIKFFNLETKAKEPVQINMKSDNTSIFDEEELIELPNIDNEHEYIITNTKIESKKINMGTFSNIIGSLIDNFDGETKDGEIGYTKQGKTGDCYLLSTINALSYTENGKEIIKNALDYQDDGSTIVHLVTGDVVITQDEINRTKAISAYSSGDDDMIIFELAIEKTYQDIVAGKIEMPEEFDKMLTQINNDVASGNPAHAFYLLTGQISTNNISEDEMYDALNYFEENGGKDFVLTAGIDGFSGDKVKKVKDINGEEVKLPCSHSYAIKNVSENTVTVVNPWDSSEEIVLPKETFVKTFSTIESVDLSGENNFEKWIDKQDKNREIINGIRYTSEYEYDKNGNIISKRVHTNSGDAGIRYTYDKDGNVRVNLYDIDENGTISDKWEISEEAAQKIIERGLLNIKPEYTIGVGLSNDIYTSELWNVSDEKWKILKDYFLNISSNRINIQDLAKYASLDIEVIDKALYELGSNTKLPAEIFYLRLSGQWTEEEFQNYLKKNNIEFRTYEEVFGHPYEYHPRTF